MPTIFLIGDSTVDTSKLPFMGWGGAFPDYVKPGVRVENHALSGCSSLSFRQQGLFEPVEQAMQPGDLLLIQFGHNDEKDDERHTGPASTFPEQLWRYCAAAQAKGAQPVLVTPVCRRFFAGATSLLYTHGEYAGAVRRLAFEREIPLCDLKKASRALYLSLGEEKTAELFVRLKPGEHPDFPDGHDDHTHFCEKGARVIAGLVAEELRRIPVCAPFIRERQA